MVGQQSQIANLVATFSANNDQLIQVARQNERIFRKQAEFVGSLDRHFDKLNRTISFVSNAFLGLTGVLGSAALGNYIRGISSTVTEFVEFGRQVDLTTRQVQLLDRVFQGDGASTQQIRTGLNNLARQLSETTFASVEVRNSFAALGLDIDQLKSEQIGLYDALLLISNGLENVEDQTQRVAIANTLFGRSGRSLLLPLQQGAEAFEEQIRAMERLGAISQAQGARLKDLAQTFTDFDNALSTSAHQILAELSPNLQGLLEVLTEVVVNVKDSLIPVFNLLNEKGVAIVVRGLGALAVLMLSNINRFVAFNKVLGESATGLRTFGSALTAVGGAVTSLFSSLFAAARVFVLVEAVILLYNVVQNLVKGFEDADVSFGEFAKSISVNLVSNITAALAALPVFIIELTKFTVDSMFRAIGEHIRNTRRSGRGMSFVPGLLPGRQEGEEAGEETAQGLIDRFLSQLKGSSFLPVFNTVRDSLNQSLGIADAEGNLTEGASESVKIMVSGLTDAVNQSLATLTDWNGQVRQQIEETGEAVSGTLSKVFENLPEIRIRPIINRQVRDTVATAVAVRDAAIRDIPDIPDVGEVLSQGIQRVNERDIPELVDNLKKVAVEINQGIGQAFGEFAGRFITDMGNIRENLRLFLSDLQRAVIRAAIVQPIAAGVSGGLTGLQGYQHGGLARGISIVGEAGPEIVDFRTPAQVYPNETLRHALSGGGGEVTINLNQTFNGTVNPGEIRSLMYAEMPNLMQLIKQHLNLELGRPSQMRRIVNRGGR